MAPPIRLRALGGLAMSKWARGEAEVERLIARGELERITGAAADGSPLLEQARRTAVTAGGLVSSDAYSAYVLAYDAARFACIALLAQQGLRATTNGGHYAVEQAVRAQFGDGFRPFGILRRRRNELEYPRLPSDRATSEEAKQAEGIAQRLITAAGELLPQLSFFDQTTQLWTACPVRIRRATLRFSNNRPRRARRSSRCRQAGQGASAAPRPAGRRCPATRAPGEAVRPQCHARQG
jgi:hypothetical protein